MVTQAESGRIANVAKLKEWLTLASLIVVVVGLAGGLHWVVSSTIAPLRADIQEINGRLDGIDGRLDRMDTRMDRTDARMDRMETAVTALQGYERRLQDGWRAPDAHRDLARTGHG